MQKEGKPDEVTWHARTAPRLIEFAAAGVFLWGTIMYALRPQVKTVKVKEKDGTEVLIPYEPVGPPSPYEPLPPGYKDKPYYVEMGLVEPPSRDLSYSQMLSAQLPGMEGYTWKSGATVQERMAAGTFDPGIPTESYVPPPEIVIVKVPKVTPPTQVTYNQNLLSQPAALEGITWKSGLTHAEKVRLGLVEP